MKLNEAYKAYIRSKPCLVCGGRSEPHHLKARGMGGKNKSGVKDFTCIPLCREHHDEIGRSVLEFVRNNGLNMEEIAKQLLYDFFFVEAYYVQNDNRSYR